MKWLDEICLGLFIETNWDYRMPCLNVGTSLYYEKHVHILLHFCYKESCGRLTCSIYFQWQNETCGTG